MNPPIMIKPTLMVKNPGLANHSIEWLLNKFKYIPITKKCAHELINRGVKEQFMMKMYRNQTEGTYTYAYLPEADVVMAFGIYEAVVVNDELALTVSLIPSQEARAIFIQEIL